MALVSFPWYKFLSPLCCFIDYGKVIVIFRIYGWPGVAYNIYILFHNTAFTRFQVKSLADGRLDNGCILTFLLHIPFLHIIQRMHKWQKLYLCLQKSTEP